MISTNLESDEHESAHQIRDKYQPANFENQGRKENECPVSAAPSRDISQPLISIPSTKSDYPSHSSANQSTDRCQPLISADMWGSNCQPLISVALSRVICRPRISVAQRRDNCQQLLMSREQSRGKYQQLTCSSNGWWILILFLFLGSVSAQPDNRLAMCVPPLTTFFIILFHLVSLFTNRKIASFFLTPLNTHTVT